MDDLAKDKIALTSNLLQAGRQWRRVAEEALAAHDISEACAAPLVWVGRLGGGIRQVTLAGHVGIEGTSLVRLLDQLSASGLLTRKEDLEDRRAKTIWLTEEGAKLAAQIERVLAQVRDDMLADVSQADIEATLRVFDAIDRASAGEQLEPLPAKVAS